MAHSIHSGRSQAAQRLRAAGVVAVGIGAGLVGFPFSALAHADTSDATPTEPAAAAAAGEPAAASASTYTDVNTAASEAFMYNPDGSINLNEGVNGSVTAYGEWAILNSDASDTFTQLYSTEVAFDSELWGDFTQFGQLVEGGIQDGTSIANLIVGAAKGSPAASFPPGTLPPEGGYSTPTDLPTTDVDVDTDTTAAQYITGIDNEAVIFTTSMQNVHDSLLTLTSAQTYGVNDQDEAQVASDLLSFQKEINGALNDFPGLSQYEVQDPGIDTYLKDLLTSELNLNESAIALTEQLSNGSADGIASANADLVANATAEYDYVQDVLNTVSYLDYLTSIGW
jgi:hypothetical protein